jgi:hypothetical protein
LLLGRSEKYFSEPLLSPFSTLREKKKKKKRRPIAGFLLNSFS